MIANRVLIIWKATRKSRQLIFWKSRTDRQVRHNLKKDKNFKCSFNTYSNICVLLVIHGRSYGKAYIDQLDMKGVVRNYQHILNIEKHTELAVLEIMKNTRSFLLT